jgi:hypothetical protein
MQNAKQRHLGPCYRRKVPSCVSHLSALALALGLLGPVSSSAQSSPVQSSPVQTSNDSNHEAQCAPAKGVNQAYKGVFYSNDFSYLNAPCLAPDDSRGLVEKTTDRLKLIPLSRHVSLSLGGEMRLRFQSEDEMGGSRLAGLDDSFTLTRVRAYADIRISDYFRGFVEVIDARKSGGSLPPRSIEVVRGDVLNGFAEFGAPIASGRAYLRAGRQELLFGAQRLISPLDWGNTRRSFDGVRASYETNEFNIHGWFTNPRVISDRSSQRDSRTDFSGVYAQWTGLGKILGQSGQVLEVYLLNLDEDALLSADSAFWTIGGRLAGGRTIVRWELEAAHQTGDQGADKISAWMLTAGAGLDLANILPGAPSLWLYYDRASGDGDDNDGKNGTFNQLFPLAHAYLGVMDLVARQNIEAYSARLAIKPHRLITASLAFHDFNLADATDALFNAGGGAIRRDATGAAGSDVGNELDAVISYSPSRWYSLQLGYARFWAGRFIRETNGTGISGDADFFFLQSTIKF